MQVYLLGWTLIFVWAKVANNTKLHNIFITTLYGGDRYLASFIPFHHLSLRFRPPKIRL